MESDYVRLGGRDGLPGSSGNKVWHWVRSWERLVRGDGRNACRPERMGVSWSSVVGMKVILIGGAWNPYALSLGRFLCFVGMTALGGRSWPGLLFVNGCFRNDVERTNRRGFGWEVTNARACGMAWHVFFRRKWGLWTESSRGRLVRWKVGGGWGASAGKGRYPDWPELEMDDFVALPVVDERCFVTIVRDRIVSSTRGGTVGWIEFCVISGCRGELSLNGVLRRWLENRVSSEAGVRVGSDLLQRGGRHDAWWFGNMWGNDRGSDRGLWTLGGWAERIDWTRCLWSRINWSISIDWAREDRRSGAITMSGVSLVR